MANRKVFYWNCADDRDHTHKRIEWAIENGYLICINIDIKEKLFNKVSIGDVILAYEPKGHKKSKSEHGEDGFCMSCGNSKFDGRQAFTEAFTLSENPVIISSYKEYRKYRNLIFRNWYCEIKHCYDIESCNKYMRTYLLNSKIYIFPITYSGKLKKAITTKTQTTSIYKYSGSIRKGFDIINDEFINNLLLNNNLF